ncbi:putative phage tail protein [Brevibacillus sp. DP1.3A]|uniref:putative phage tail protein n=1 Tax=Brevibacillus sp. DP1.3A TaxID=2738867 RepID=UPI00156B9003|nr:putative phage tail protein [Brevibacillus sp. DP1.3A]UED78058.1 YmfQ family protein [Brevibacillus sp. DP1.3A]
MARADDMLKRLQPFQRKSKVFKAIFDAEATQFDKREAIIADLHNQMSVDTATWALSIYERELGIPVDLSKAIDLRRSHIKSKMRGVGKFSASMALAIASAFSDHVSDVSFDGRIRIHFEGAADLSLTEIGKALEEQKPAHLACDYQAANYKSEVAFVSPHTPIALISTYQACGTFSAGGEYEL